MNRELFTPGETPFNLTGEALDNSTTQEGEARVRALAEREARKAQHLLDLEMLCHVNGAIPMNDEQLAALYRAQDYEMEQDEGRPDLSHDSDCTYRFGHAAECSCNKDSRALFAQILKPFTPKARQ